MRSDDPIRAIADAVLYEGYILWPYRRSALKNQRRFTFGGVYPPAHERLHPDDPCLMRTEVLVRASSFAFIDVSVRFLHVVERTVARRGTSGWEPVDELEVDGERYLSWEEAAEREVAFARPLGLRALQRGASRVIDVPAGEAREQVGAGAGVVVRRWEGLRGAVRCRAAPVREGIWRVSVEIENATGLTAGGERSEALRRTFCSTHTVLRVAGGAFVSLTDPPADLAGEAAACANVGTWPVLAGDPGATDTVLSSPIILEDHPQVAPESPGDLFDGGEIDGLLVLNILSLTDEEKAEMAASDPRAREILERTEALTPDQLMALHGTIRELAR